MTTRRSLGLFAALILLLSAGLELAGRAAVSRAPDGWVRLTAENAAELVGPALRRRGLTDPEAGFIADILAKGVSTDSRRGLEQQLAAEVSEHELGQAADLPLRNARERLQQAQAKGRSSAAALGPQARIAAELARSGVVARTPEEYLGALRPAIVLFALGWFLPGLALGRRGGRWWGFAVLAIASSLSAIGFAHQVTLDALAAPAAAPKLAQHVLFGGAGAGMAVVTSGWRWRWPSGLHAWPARLRPSVEMVQLALAMVLVTAIVLWGQGPAGSIAKINLRTVMMWQPLEVAKVLVVLAAARVLALYADHWTTLRVRIGGRWRFDLRPPLLIASAVATFAGAVGGLAHDWGTVLVAIASFVAVAFILLPGRQVAVGATVAALLGASGPTLASWLVDADFDQKVLARLEMWRSPWINAQYGGDHMARAYWAFASGGLLGAAEPLLTELPAAKTDMAIVALTERFGFVVFLLVVLLFALLAVLGAFTSATARYADARQRATGVAALMLVFAQAGLNLACSTGVMPLTGIPLPFISTGGTASVTYMALVGLIAAPAAGAVTHALSPLPSERRLAAGLLAAVGVIAAVLFTVTLAAFWYSLGPSSEIAARPAFVRGAPTAGDDRQFVALENPRITRILPEWGAGAILDTRGLPMAFDEQPGLRRYPMGAAASSMLGIRTHEVAPLPGTVEATLPGFGASAHRAYRVEVHLEGTEGFAHWSIHGDQREAALVASKLTVDGGVSAARVVKVTARDLTPAAKIARWSPEQRSAARAEALREVAALRLTIDAALQRRLFVAANEAMRKHRASAAAIVVLDVATGAVLAQVSAPAVDPETFNLAVYHVESGQYGSMQDYAARSWVAPGSVWKPMQVLAALAAGFSPTQAVQCAHVEHLGPERERVTDHRAARPHGAVSLGTLLAQSCNVAAAKLAYATPTAKTAELAQKFGFAKFDVHGPVGATGYGQGRTLATPLEVAQAYQAIAANGTLRRCALVMVDGQPRCEVVQVAPPAHIAIVIGGLRRAVTEGTATTAKPSPADNFAVYGKTGTAQAQLRRGERGPARDHAWFGGFIEGDRERRFAFAILLQRGGSGGTAAAPVAIEIGRALVAEGYLNGRGAQASP